MRLLVLASIAPDFRHFRAGQTVLAVLLEAMILRGFEVGVAIAGEPSKMDRDQAERLSKQGIKILNGKAFEVNKEPRKQWITRKFRQLLSLTPYGADSGFYGFVNSREAVESLEQFKPTSALLFWDTCFEHLLPELNAAGVPCYGYIARPPQAASMVTLAQQEHSFRNWVVTLQLKADQKKHINRMRLLRDSFNICAIDAKWYSAQGVKCGYLSNTWPDPFGQHWERLRAAAEDRRGGVHVLGNLGGLNATGNKFGMQYLVKEVLPILKAKKFNNLWVINICGRFNLPKDLEAGLTDKAVSIRGFVEDIDDEVIGNHVFILLNNAGPYTGGYTRVMYAFASGACLIAHARLAESMPELISGKNCFLGNTAEEIATLIHMAIEDKMLRARISRAARATYEKSFSPALVAKELSNIVMQVL